VSKGNFTKQSTATGICHAISMVCILLTQIIIARVFGAEGRGIFANAFTLAGFLTLMLDSGHAPANAYFVASGKQKISEAVNSTLIGLVISVLLLAVFTFYTVFFRPSFVVLLSNSIIILAFAVIPITWSTEHMAGILRGTGRPDLAYWVYGISSSSRLVSLIGLCLLLHLKNMEIVFITGIIGAVMSLVWVLWFLRSHLTFACLRLNLQAFKQSIIYSMKFFFARIANPMQIRIEMIVIPLILANVVSLGVYAQGFAILNQLILSSTVVGYVLMPRVAKDGTASAFLTARVCRLVLFVSVCIGIAILFLAKPVVPFVFGEDFSATVPLMLIMLPGMVFRSFSKIIYYYLQGRGKPATISVVSFFSLAVLLGIDILLIPVIGIKGAAIGTLCSCLVEFIIFAILFSRESGVTFAQMFFIRKEDLQLIIDKVLGLVKLRVKS